MNNAIFIKKYMSKINFFKYYVNTIYMMSKN